MKPLNITEAPENAASAFPKASLGEDIPSQGRISINLSVVPAELVPAKWPGCPASSKEGVPLTNSIIIPETGTYSQMRK